MPFARPFLDRCEPIPIDADGTAVTDSGYGSGGIVLDLPELEKELAEAIVRRIGSELQNARREKIVTQAGGDELYSRLRSVFVDENWMPS